MSIDMVRVKQAIDVVAGVSIKERRLIQLETVPSALSLNVKSRFADCFKTGYERFEAILARIWE